MTSQWLSALRLIIFALMLVSTAAHAEVEVSFWSHARDRDYEHTFLVMRGTVDATGARVNTNIGFTAAARASPLLLVRPANGRMQRVSAGYVQRSRAHFTLRLTDLQYAALQAFIGRWRAESQPSYNLRSRNCVHFVMGAAAALGLRVNRATTHTFNPAAFLAEIEALNPQLVATR